MRYWIIAKILLLVFLLSLLLSGCSSTQELWIYSNDNWKMEMELAFNFEAIPGISASIEDFDLDFNLGSMTSEIYTFILEQKVLLDQAKGLEADLDVRQHGEETVFKYDLEGENIDQLRESLVMDEALYEQYPELDAFVVQYSILEHADGTIEIEAVYPFVGLGQTFILHGKNIEDYGTASEVKGNKASWSNPTYIHVRFTPVNEMFSIKFVYLGIGLGILLVVGVVFYLIQVRAPSLPKQRRSYRSQKKYKNPYYKKNAYLINKYRKK